MMGVRLVHLPNVCFESILKEMGYTSRGLCIIYHHCQFLDADTQCIIQEFWIKNEVEMGEITVETVQRLS